MLRNLTDYKELFKNIKPSHTKKWSTNIFQNLKPYLIDAIIKIVNQNKKLNRGPKPNPLKISTFLDAYFELLDNGSKMGYIEKNHQISLKTYYHYQKLLMENKLIEQFHSNLFNGTVDDNFKLTDASHIRSLNGSIGVDYGYKEHGKKALKITILTSRSKVIYLSGLEPDNVHDLVAFENLTNCNKLDEPVNVLADAGYNGKRFKNKTKKNGFNVISCIKKNGKYKKPSHTLKAKELQMLKDYRPRVEHVFNQLKIFQGIQIKRNKEVKNYNQILQLGILLCLSIMEL